MKTYKTEREGQLDFFERYHIRYETNNDTEVLKDSTDGIYLGGIFEFKLVINDLNKVLFQTIKYLSKERIKGNNVPANIFLIDLNKNLVYTFKSKDYFTEIHKVYSGASSKQNDGFINKAPNFKLQLDMPEDDNKFRKLILENNFMSIDIDENCIVGWTERYYRENPTATKDDFLKDDGELRNPDKFKDFINPYTDESNEKFKYIMDKLNDKLKKKKLGIFYTPIPYCEKAAELVREAIKRVPEGNDYIILDRCAGTGNLESVLTDEELSHCILSTYEYYEWLVLRERLEDKVRMILPENKEDITFENGLIKENDAMSKEFVENEYIKQFLDNEKCTVIIYENPPYQFGPGVNGNISRNDSDSYVPTKMKEEINGLYTQELANRFIWSANKYYLKNKEENSMVVFSPIKYWKINNAFNQKFLNGFIFNRKYFHATPSAICCILWSGQPQIESVLKDVSIFDINESSSNKKIDIKRVKEPISKILCTPNSKKVIYNYSCKSDGYFDSYENSIKKNDVVGYLVASSFESAFNNFSLMNSIYTSKRNKGEYLFKNSYLKKLPIGAAKLYYANSDNWWDDIYYSSADGGTEKVIDKLKNCGKTNILRVKKASSEYYDKRKFDTDEDSTVYCGLDGYPTSKKPAIKPIYNKNIVGSLVLTSFKNAFNNIYLSRINIFNGNNGSITHLRKDKYIKILPAACAKWQGANSDNWWDDLYYSTSDGGTAYEKDSAFLKSCLIYTSLCQFNKCLSFKGSDGRDYYNEICFDSLSTHKSQALIDIANYKLNSDDKKLIKLFDGIMTKAATTKSYNKNYSYGLYQIIQELNTSKKDDFGKTIYDYPDLNADIKVLKTKLKEYYKKYIEPKCFKYELLK